MMHTTQNYGIALLSTWLALAQDRSKLAARSRRQGPRALSGADLEHRVEAPLHLSSGAASRCSPAAKPNMRKLQRRERNTYT